MGYALLLAAGADEARTRTAGAVAGGRAVKEPMSDA